MTKKKLDKEREKQDKKIKRLYTLIWFLACPLAYVVSKLTGFAQINVVYWTLLVVPVLLAAYNVRQVPPVILKKGDTPVEEALEGEVLEELPEPEPDETEGVTRTQRIKLLALALKPPVIIAAPILVTLIVDLCIR
ncbi:hypothetical protein [Hydrogenoanaerobacterium sp.]|uniref:hypothetical protein n=1 Tax=Hydrogenoanaerobacterium sp. TaxID=2953763 RepID=UPI00289CA123|nr:hypothetical protein [Hydrogenoanaerobacterium sp.]